MQTLDATLTLADGRQVGYLVRGPEEATPVVWVHGWPGSRYEQLISPDGALERQGVRIISVDRPGYGNTDPLSGTRAERMADVLAVCDELGIESFGVIGSSCGGSNSVALAASAPQRVERLVLAAGQMPYDDPSVLDDLNAEDWSELAELRDGRTPALEKSEAEYRERLVTGGAEGMDWSSFGDLERQWLTTPWVWQVLDLDMREAARRSYEGLLEDGLMCVTPFEFDPATVTCPVFAVHGDRDDWEPIANLRRFTATWPNSRVIVLEGLGHLAPHLYPDLLLSLAAGRAA